ncbi:penicillin-binding protein 2 [Rhodobacterales bacterium HKCCE3408]|nr:penicillin-binding protein 2 [Rhodobacterales bacterium HKCCE3408]
MTARVPLRPLPRILRAREEGQNPDRIERENLARRHQADRDRLRVRAESRLLMLAMCFFAAFLTVGMRMASLAASEPEEPVIASRGSALLGLRADITDRNGRVLATNLNIHSLYSHPYLVVDPEAAALGLSEIFPDLSAEAALEDLTSESNFVWLRDNLSPEQEQAVHDLGEPGLLFGDREMRLYPNGALAAHILGGARFGREDVDFAEIIGVAGVEAEHDAFLRDPANNGAPLRLSLDLTIQAAVEEVLAGGMEMMQAQGASAVLMDIDTGEIIAMASLPDFDPNARPLPAEGVRPEETPIFNRAVQGVYELGSVFKLFTVAQALDIGLVNPSTMINTERPYIVTRERINDFHYYGPEQSVHDVIVHSSNIGTARIAAMIGPERMQGFLRDLGLADALPLEMVEAGSARPLWPNPWREISTATVAYGHGIAVTPVHLAAAYATVLGGGTRVTPTLIAQDTPPAPGPRVVSEEVSAVMRGMLADVVTEGTATMAQEAGYPVGGKTGTADIVLADGSGYAEDRNRTTFASVFPALDPQYVLITTLEEPWVEIAGNVERTAGYTAVPVGTAIIRRVGPLLGLRPEIEPVAGTRLSSASN